MTMHILQGGIKNGDKSWLEKASGKNIASPSWIAPKSVEIGDDAVIYIGGFGFFATARIKSKAVRRANWPRRYGAALDSVKLIQPPISLGIIERKLPGLNWARYPRSITTVSPKLALRINHLINDRRERGVHEPDDKRLPELNMDELRQLAILAAQPIAKKSIRKVSYRARSHRVHYYVLRRADGNCEGCELNAPFIRLDGSPYLEPHHTQRLADEGPDHPSSVIALCPNCHRRAHSAHDAKSFNNSLIKKLASLEDR